MDCPRCKLMLRPMDYEGVEVDLCDNCWGMWLDSGELRRVIDVRTMDFSDEERALFVGPGADGAVELGSSQGAECPVCSRPMELVHGELGAPLTIDRCGDHGVWLDPGEIKAIQAVAESSADLHRLVIDKLRLREG